MSLERIGFVPIPPGDKAGFDHADVYAPGDLVYVAHTGASRVDVIDGANQRHLRSLPDLPGVAGVLIDELDDLLFTSDRGCARVSVFRCSNETLLGQVPVGRTRTASRTTALRDACAASTSASPSARAAPPR